jgi:hypothetical protein
MKRDIALAAIRVAGYHEDYKRYMRIYVENRISHATAKKSFEDGLRMKREGARCDCSDCKQ